MKIIVLFYFFLLISVHSFAREFNSSSGQCSLNQKPKCSELIENYCEDIWNDQNKGNVKGKVGSLLLGQSAKSGLSEAERIDVTALAESADGLPASLRQRLAPILSRLKLEMTKENDSTAWYRKIQEIREEFQSEVEQIAKESSATSKPMTDREKEMKYNASLTSITDAIVNAKYKKHHNWQRVERVFDQVKKDMIFYINTMNLSDEEKKERIEKISSVKATLPLAVNTSGIAKWIQDDNCRKNMVNAFYWSATNSLTVCAGLFNSYQSDSGLYFVIAHELAHPINLGYLRQERFNKSPLGQTITNLINNNGNAYTCGDWRNVTYKAFISPSKLQCEQSRYDHLLECFGAKNYKNRSIDELKKKAKTETDKFFSKANLCELVNSEKYPDMYLQPKKYVEYQFNNFLADQYINYEGVVPDGALEDFYPMFIFTQNARCNRNSSCLQLLEQTRAMAQNVAETKNSYMCNEFNQASGEYESDWFAAKLFVKYIDRYKSYTDKREAVAQGVSSFCPHHLGFGAVLKGIPVSLYLSIFTDYFANENHPDSKDRRNGIYFDEISRKLNCEQEKKRSYMGCGT